MKRILPLSLVLIGALFIVLGVYLGENTMVWRKAINICMECIGLG